MYIQLAQSPNFMTCTILINVVALGTFQVTFVDPQSCQDD